MTRSKPCRVLHVIDSLDLGGAQIVLENLIRHGDRAAYEFEVATMHGHGTFWERIAALDVPMHSLSFHHKVPLYVPRLIALCARRRYDVVHTHLLASNVIAKPVAALSGVPVRINHDHCNDKLTDPRKWALPADRFTNRFSSHVIAVSESTRRFLIEHEGLAEERVSRIYNGIDLEKYQPRPAERLGARKRFGLSPDAFVIGGIGRLTFQKNFALFLEIAAAVSRAHPKTEFVIAGTGEDEAELKQQYTRLGISDRMHFLGMVKDTAELYPAMDLLLLTSRYEGLPITILEAMATGVPIVASNLDGMREILTDGKSAALISPGAAAAFTERVGQLIADPAAGHKVADEALRIAQKDFSAKTMARKVEEIYQSCLQKRR